MEQGLSSLGYEQNFNDRMWANLKLICSRGGQRHEKNKQMKRYGLTNAFLQL